MRPNEGVDSNNREIQFYCHRKCQAATNLGPTTHITYVFDEWLQQIRYVLIFSCPSGISQSTEPTYILTKIKKKTYENETHSSDRTYFFPQRTFGCFSLCVVVKNKRQNMCLHLENGFSCHVQKNYIL